MEDGPETLRRTLSRPPTNCLALPECWCELCCCLSRPCIWRSTWGAGEHPKILDIFADARLLSPATLTTLLVTTAVALIPVRLFFFAAVAFDFQQLPTKFRRLFPVLLGMDLLWALSPFLLVHHVSLGSGSGDDRRSRLHAVCSTLAGSDVCPGPMRSKPSGNHGACRQRDKFTIPFRCGKRPCGTTISPEHRRLQPTPGDFDTSGPMRLQYRCAQRRRAGPHRQRLRADGAVERPLQQCPALSAHRGQTLPHAHAWHHQPTPRDRQSGHAKKQSVRTDRSQPHAAPPAAESRSRQDVQARRSRNPAGLVDLACCSEHDFGHVSNFAIGVATPERTDGPHGCAHQIATRLRAEKTSAARACNIARTGVAPTPALSEPRAHRPASG